MHLIVFENNFLVCFSFQITWLPFLDTSDEGTSRFNGKSDFVKSPANIKDLCLNCVYREETSLSCC